MTTVATARPILAGPSEERTAPPTSMLDRVTCILDLFDHPRRRLSLEEISRRTGLPRSSAHRILEHMIGLRWISRSDAGYALGTRVSGLGRRVGGVDMLRSAAAPVLHDLSVATGRVVHLAMLEGDSVVFLDKVGAQYADVPSRVGARASATRTALGKAMLWSMSPEQVEAQLTGGGQPGSVRRNFDELHVELAKVRQRKGLAFERGTFTQSLGCVAVPVTPVNGVDCPPAAISVVLARHHDFERLAPMVVQAGRRVSQELQRVSPSLSISESGEIRTAV